MTKVCTKCQTELDIINFSFNDYKNKYSSWCQDCVRRGSFLNKQNKKLKILTHYGNGKLQCVKCGCGDINSLSLDHINNNGSEHRKEIGGCAYLYNWVSDHNFPDGFQTLCFNCQFIKEAERMTANKENWSKEKVRAKRYQNKLKIKIMDHYGCGKCVECGFDDIRALSIDHTMGGGCAHRKEILEENAKIKFQDRNGGGGHNFYRWLKNNNFPNGYQVLCMNCQQIKKILHETKRLETPDRCLALKFNTGLSRDEKIKNFTLAREKSMQLTKDFYNNMNNVIKLIKDKGINASGDIADELNEMGYKTKNGVEWKHYHVSYILRCMNNYVEIT